MPDHVHMPLSILPKCAVSEVVGYIKVEMCDLFGMVVWGAETQLYGTELLCKKLLHHDGRPG